MHGSLRFCQRAPRWNERLTIDTDYVGGELTDTSRPPQRLLAAPEVAAALPATLKRIDFDMALEEGELEAVLSNNSSVNVIGMDGMVRPLSELHQDALVHCHSPCAARQCLGLLPQARYHRP